jgi:3-dehydroquinate synthase
MQRFSVPVEYPVYFARNVFDPASQVVAEAICRLGESRRHRVLACVDSGLAAAQPSLVERIKEYFHARGGAGGRLELLAGPVLLPGGPAAKTDWKAVRELMWTMGNLHLDRQSFVLAIGGGSMLDMAGFAAGIVHRGVRLVRVPTTTLSQCDAGIGVKNGMDEHGKKNFVGTFAAPFAVINDLDMLTTLSHADWIAGVAEALKVAIIKDAEFFDELCASAAAIGNRDQAAMERLVRRCAKLHLDHIAGGGDPFELGSARPLDFGHWSAHKLEIMSMYQLSHGQAVSIGIAIDSCYAAQMGLLSEQEVSRVLTSLEACGLPTWSAHLGRLSTDGVPEVLDGLEEFREHLGGALTVTLPRGIGARVEVHTMDAGALVGAIESLRRRAGG